MFWYRSRQYVKPRSLSGSPWLIGTCRFRPLVRMVDCAARLKAASPITSAKASASHGHRADVRAAFIPAMVQRLATKIGGDHEPLNSSTSTMLTLRVAD